MAKIRVLMMLKRVKMYLLVLLVTYGGKAQKLIILGKEYRLGSFRSMRVSMNFLIGWFFQAGHVKMGGIVCRTLLFARQLTFRLLTRHFSPHLHC
jgi:hypothetical protein